MSVIPAGAPSSPSSIQVPNQQTGVSRRFSLDGTVLPKDGGGATTVYQTPITSAVTVDALQSPPSVPSERDILIRP